MTISRIDQDHKHQHGWWVRYFEYGAKRPNEQKFFSDRMYNGRESAYEKAKIYEDLLKDKYNYDVRRKPVGSPNPDIRKPKRKNKANKTGILGVQRTKRIRPNGAMYETYVASYPIAPGKTKLHVFSVNKFGERVSFRLAIMARLIGLSEYYDERYKLKNHLNNYEQVSQLGA
ncbi:MAG: hypothetical protein GY786_09365 [Proteobacteria bacterium]|nr:hypothetical protein [Pseudomonadota bacterium]